MSESTALVPLAEIERMAVTVVGSKMFPGINTKESAVALMLLCQSEGLHPMQALTRYHIIQNRPAMKADAMLAEFMRRGGTVEWKEWTNEACEALFVSKGCPGGVTVRWTIEDAKRAGVTSNPTWTKYPRQMLKARVASDGVRMSDPAVNQGRYTPEETEDFAEEKPKAVPIEVEILSNERSEPLGWSCAECGSEIKQYPSESKDFPGRLYWLCEGAKFEYDKAVKQGAPVAKAKAQIKKHYGGASRQWAEAWPKEKSQSEAGPIAEAVGVTESPAPAGETPILEQLQAISESVAERVAAEQR